MNHFDHKKDRGNKMGNNQFKKLKGFTLVELITVVAIISMIAIYITIEINRSNDDAKIGIAAAYLSSSVPAAISSYRARHMGNCNGIAGTSGTDALPELESRGMSDTSPWGTPVTAVWSSTNSTITVSFTVPASADGTLAQTLRANLDSSSGQFVTLPAATIADGSAFSVTYSCA